MRWTYSFILLVALALAACEASVSVSFLSKTRGGVVVKKSGGVGAGGIKGSTSVKRTRVYKKENFVARLVGGIKTFFSAYFSSLINPTYEKELGVGSTGTGGTVAGLKANQARRKRVGGRRVGSISDLAPEPSSCGG